MDELHEQTRQTPAPARSAPDLDSWRGDIRRQPPAWRRRPRAGAMREIWNAARPILAQIGEGRSWE